MRKTAICILGIIIILILIVVSNIGRFSFEKESALTPVNSGWQYRAGDSPIDKNGKFSWFYDNNNALWKDFSVHSHPNINNSNSYLWERVKLPKQNYRDPSIYFYTKKQDFQVFMDGERIYSFGNLNNKKLQGSFWHTIDLPNIYGGKVIYIRMHSIDKGALGEIINFEVGSKADEIVNIIMWDFLNFTMALLFVVIGIISLFVSFIRLRGKQLFIYASLCCICAGIWLISMGSMNQMFIYAPEFWGYIKMISGYSIPITFGLFINKLFNSKFSKMFNIIVVFHMLLLVVSLLGDFFNVMGMTATLPVYFFSFSLSTIMVMIVIIKNYSKHDVEVKIFSLGFIALCFSGIFDGFNWAFNPNHTQSYLTQWGMIIFLISLCIVVNLHYAKAKDDAIKYEKKLIESQQQLKFFSNISHELRTPLNSILSSLQLLNISIPDDSIKINGKDASDYFDVMRLNSFRLLKLVNNLIDINKIDAGYLKADFQNKDIVSVVEDITQSIANYIKSKGISIIFDTDVEEKVMACDIEKIERIMLNLLSNAVKFSKEGGEIYVEIHDADTEVVITVADTGIGIMADKLNDIFKRFVQVDKSFTRSHEGSGIGLSLVKELVEMHGGNIAVESEYGRGSKFMITLPVKQAENDTLNENMKIMEIEDIHNEKINIEFSDI
jgi:signal transduction histidine kinase